MSKRETTIIPHLQSLKARGLSDGGFSASESGRYRPDATAWATLAISQFDDSGDLVGKARSRLAASQREDGRVSISPDHPEGFWPTPIAVMAWQGSAGYRKEQHRAIEFLVRVTGIHFVAPPGFPPSHDPAIRGWPWMEGTHSMVEPTALTVLALKASGYRDHPRTREAVRMLMNRQLPHGGWNYGNTIAYGRELYPQPETTGLALAALSGEVPVQDLSHSIAYLEKHIPRIKTPLSLGWSLIGMNAWGIVPGEAKPWILECLSRQSKYGPYGTTDLCLVLLAFLGWKGTFPPEGKTEGRTA